MTGRRAKLRHLAGALILASGIAGLLAIGVRAGWGGPTARALEGATLFLAAGAYLAHVLAHHQQPRELLTRSILVSAFALWGIVQIAPGLPGNAILNDLVIVLFGVDLAILVSPWSCPREPVLATQLWIHQGRAARSVTLTRVTASTSDSAAARDVDAAWVLFRT